MSSKREVTGNVQVWDSEEGWGVLVSPEVEGTVFASFAVVDVAGYVDLHEGQPVRFRYETPGQDGCDHTATFVKLLSA